MPDDPERNTIHNALQYMPIVAAWMTFDGINPDEVKTLRINNNVCRDYEKEVRTGSHWMLWRPGEHITVTLTLKNGDVHHQDIPRGVWQEQNIGTNPNEEHP